MSGWKWKYFKFKRFSLTLKQFLIQKSVMLSLTPLHASTHKHTLTQRVRERGVSSAFFSIKTEETFIFGSVRNPGTIKCKKYLFVIYVSETFLFECLFSNNYVRTILSIRDPVLQTNLPGWDFSISLTCKDITPNLPERIFRYHLFPVDWIEIGINMNICELRWREEQTEIPNIHLITD